MREVSVSLCMAFVQLSAAVVSLIHILSKGKRGTRTVHSLYCQSKPIRSQIHFFWLCEITGKNLHIPNLFSTHTDL